MSFTSLKNKTMINLNIYGWNNKLNLLKQESTYNSLPHGRVSVVHRTCYNVISENGLFQCELSGNMMYAKTEFELPCTGDWVIFQPFDENKGIIVDVLPRERILYRKKNDTIADKQAIASYVDKAFIVQSLDDNFNVRRIERFMFQILEENIKPALILNKSDLNFDNKKANESIEHLASQMPVFFTSIHNPETILQLQEYISEGETVVFVGSSGVGKSSLINALCGKSTFATSDISISTGKGRHTSTRREMILIDNSGIVIDTPGVREFGLAADNPDSLVEMLDISHYAKACRFADCTHVNEPDCAVKNAVTDGHLDSKIYDSYLKLRRETQHFSISEHEKRKRDKSFSKLVDEVKKRKMNF